MNPEEFSALFDVHFNNITSGQAPGLDEYEKSVFLTKAQDEIVKNFFDSSSAGNHLKQGFDDSTMRQADFSNLMKVADCALYNRTVSAVFTNTATHTIKNVVLSSATLYDSYGNIINWYSIPSGVYNVAMLTQAVTTTVPDGEDITYDIGDFVITRSVATEGSGTYYAKRGTFDANGTLLVTVDAVDKSGIGIDYRSDFYLFPSDVFVVINESIRTTQNKYLLVVPLRYDEYSRLMRKPFKRPLKYQAWRLLNSYVSADTRGSRVVEIITNIADDVNLYRVRYIRRPKPIILADLSSDELSIEGYSVQMGSEVDPILHENILQRAVELAKVAYIGTNEEYIKTGERSE